MAPDTVVTLTVRLLRIEKGRGKIEFRKDIFYGSSKRTCRVNFGSNESFLIKKIQQLEYYHHYY